ncbi:NADPH-dependent FMN reductase [Streptosporangium amethystogenes subsp. fukuiense]|uniref:NADPH-dependent FMN reductase n=1 Tax=Streptosporangium amethystogenes subsp. fukuiense TaxID=698418 RepID=A0ABW2T9Y6_9ACTN
MSEKPIRLVVIVGSVRSGRFGPTVANWFARQARRHGEFDVDVVDLAEVPLPLTLPEPGPAPSPETAQALASLTSRLDTADAFVIVTPEYNHSFPASLKNVIDRHYKQWRAKPVGFVSYGGLSGGLRAVEHLRLVFAELHAVGIRDTVSFHGAGQFDDKGDPTNPEGCTRAADILLDRLVWWARTLDAGRTARPYAV